MCVSGADPKAVLEDPAMYAHTTMGPLGIFLLVSLLDLTSKSG